MKKILFSIIFIATATTFFACNNGDYNANATSPANNSVNPLDVLDSAGFNWSGTDAVSAYVNGNFVHIDSTQAYFTFTGGANVINAYYGISRGFSLHLEDVYGNNIYPMGYSITNRYITFSDSLATGPINYFSYYGNVGQVQIIRNDPTRIVGRFHFQGLDKINGTLINVSNGWFSLHK